MKKRQKLYLPIIGQFPLAALTSGISIIFLYGNLLKSEFGIIDDHEFFLFMGERNRTSVLEFFSILFNKTEVGLWGHYERFRPFYYVTRILETVVFGRNATLYYAAQFILTLIFTLSSLKLISAYLTFRFKSLLINLQLIYLGFLFITIPALLDIVTRLGTSEIYLIALIPMIIHKSIEGLTRKISNKTFIFLHILIVLAIGFKENAIVLVVFAFLVFWKQARQHNLGLKKIFTHLVTLSWAIFCFLGPALSIQRNGGYDFYGQKRSFYTSLINLSLMKSNYLLIISLIVILAVLSFSLSLGIASRVASWPFVLLVVIALVIRIFETIVYGPLLTYDLSRYAILRELMDKLILIAAFVVVINFIIVLLEQREYLKRILATLACIIFMLITIRDSQNISSINVKVNNSVQFTNDFRDNFSKLRKATTQSSDVIIIVTKPYDFEPVYSINRYLKSYFPSSNLYLGSNFDEDYAGFEEKLVNSMKTISKVGDISLGIKPYSEINLSKKQVCIMFDKLIRHERCKTIIIFKTNIY